MAFQFPEQLIVARYKKKPRVGVVLETVAVTQPHFSELLRHLFTRSGIPRKRLIECEDNGVISQCLRQPVKRHVRGRWSGLDPRVWVKEKRGFRLCWVAVENMRCAEEFAEHLVLAGPFTGEHWIDVYGIPEIGPTIWRRFAGS